MPILLVVSALLTISFVSAPIFGQVSNNGSGSAMMSEDNSTSMANTTTAGNATGNLTLNLGKALFVEHSKGTNYTNVSQNEAKVTFEGNGTFMLPSGNISTTDKGSATIYSTNSYSRVYGHLLIMTADGAENATVTFVELMPQNATEGIGTAFIQTNSTGQLSELNNAIGVFKDETKLQTDTVTFWRWK